MQRLKDSDIYSKGIVTCSVCVPKEMPIKEIETQVNFLNSTGIKSQWKVSKEKFKDGNSNPKICENDNTRLHYLLNC